MQRVALHGHGVLLRRGVHVGDHDGFVVGCHVCVIGLGYDIFFLMLVMVVVVRVDDDGNAHVRDRDTGGGSDGDHVGIVERICHAVTGCDRCTRHVVACFRRSTAAVGNAVGTRVDVEPT